MQKQPTTIRSEEPVEYAASSPPQTDRTVPLSYSDTAELLARLGVDDGAEDGMVGVRERAHPNVAIAFELVTRWYEERLQETRIFTSPQHVSRFLALHLRDRPTEGFGVIFLDGRHRMLAFEIMFTGTVDGSSVHPRVIAQRALTLNACAVVLSHNHPSGQAEPSRADRAITERVRDALALIDIRTLDHIVIGQGEAVSFAERGWL